MKIILSFWMTERPPEDIWLFSGNKDLDIHPEKRTTEKDQKKEDWK